MAVTTVSRLIFDSIVPDKYRGDLKPDQAIGNTEIKNILQRVAEDDPSKYKDISFNLLRLGSRSAVETGSSFSMKDLESPIDKDKLMREVGGKEHKIFSDPKLTQEQKEEQLSNLYGGYSDKMPGMVFDASMVRGSNLAKMVASGARGNKSQLNSNIGADFLVMDQNEKPVPIGIKSSYAEGMNPAEYFASSYGTRSGLVSVKFCQMAGTEVLMSDFSSKRIEEIIPGEWVMGSDMEGRMRPVRVTQLFDNGPRECVKYTFRKLSSRSEVATLFCTPDHKVLSELRAWTKRKHRATNVPSMLPVGTRGVDEFIAIPQSGFDCESYGVTESRSLFLGLMLGGGHLSELDSFVLSIGYDFKLLEEIRPYFRSLNFDLRLMAKDSPNYRLCYVERPKQIWREYEDGTCTNSGCETMKWLRDIKLLGRLSSEKFIPQEVHQWNNESVSALLRGLFTAGGSIYERDNKKSGSFGAGISFCSVSRQMVETVAFLLEKRFGIYCDKINIIDKETRQWAVNDMFDIKISHSVSVRRFMEKIGFLGEKQERALRIVAKMPEISIHNRHHTFKRLSAEPLGERPTYDLEVDSPEHTYVLANSIVVSNSTMHSGFLCIFEDELVRMADMSLSQIKDISVGQVVMGSDKFGNSIPVRVINVFRNGAKQCYIWMFGSHGHTFSVIATEDHKILGSITGESDLQQLTLGNVEEYRMFAYVADSNTTFPFLSKTEFGIVETCDIEVDHPDHLFVLANGIIVSNSKQINASVMDLMTTEHDCGTKNGIPVDADDSDNPGSVLAKDTAGHPAGTILTPKIIADIKKAGKEQIVVRSALTCQSASGICARCAGVRERGGLPALGDAVGLAAGSAHSEPLSQSLLSKKHSGGVANASKATGFKAINAIFQVPDTFPDRACLAEGDGVVSKVEKLPQGGFNVSVGDRDHYVSSDHDVLVKPGQKLEAGDRISSGTINPSDIVRLKGVGEGRLNMVKQIRDTFNDNGIYVSRRNAEIVARGVVDHVKVNDSDETSSYLPDETVEYSAFSKDYKPHKDSTVLHPSKAIGQYLEAPILHYSIGTRITPSVVKTLGDLDEHQVLVSHHQPAFEPVMVRLMENPSHDKDWMSQMGTSYVQKNLKKNVISGDVSSSIHGTNPLPALAYATEFGKPPKGTVGY